MGANAKPATILTVGWWVLLAVCVIYGLFALSMAGAEVASWIGLQPDTKARAVPGPFVLHALLGGICLLAGPLQFHAGLRHRRQGLHRILGRVYVASVLVSSATGLWVAAFFDVSLASKLAFGTLAVLWGATTVVGLAKIRSRALVAHTEWMTRSFALSLFFVSFSLWVPGLQATGLPEGVAHPLGVFLSWSTNLVVAEAWIRRMRATPPRRAASALPSSRPGPPPTAPRPGPARG